MKNKKITLFLAFLTCMNILQAGQPVSLDLSGIEEETAQVEGGEYVCGTCGKDFARRFNLTKHIRTHTDEKPSASRVCGKPSARKSPVKTPVISVHKNDDGDPSEILKEAQKAIVAAAAATRGIV